MNMQRQIEKVIAAQGISKDDAADQIRGRVYEARQYLKIRAQR